MKQSHINDFRHRNNRSIAERSTDSVLEALSPDLDNLEGAKFKFDNKGNLIEGSKAQKAET
jgi:hypothetical protein